MEKVKRERCPVCGGLKMVDNFVKYEDGTIRVYVECAHCGSFVARYTLQRYTSNKPYESLLHFFRKPVDSGRSVLKNIEAFTEEIEKEFKEVKERIKEKEENQKIEEIICGIEDN